MDNLDELLTRGVANSIPNTEELKKLLMSGKTLTVYLGIDPTATKIHLGHAVPLRKLHAFAKQGHTIRFLIGDFTALIGDTSDKDTERPVLTEEEIEHNFQTYKAQAGKILDFSLPNVTVVHNSEWLRKLSFEDINKLCQHFAVGDFVGRELIRKRLQENKRVGLHELLYPVMQGYDSYHMDIDIQIGGTDQTFNMQAGRTLQKDLRKKQSYILATTFLTGTDGRKMSKSWGNAIWMDDAPDNMYAKVMSLHDDLILEYFTLATNVSLKQIGTIEKRLHTGENPRDIKKELAYSIVSELYDEKSAQSAQSTFERVVQGKEKPTSLQTLTADSTTSLIDIVRSANIVPSNAHFERLIEQKGIKIDGELVTQAKYTFSTGDHELQIGKNRLYTIRIS